MNLVHTRHRKTKTAIGAQPQLRKCQLVWWLVVIGIFLIGLIVGRTHHYSSEKGFANDTTLLATGS
jgi:hypothetical protein